jgi:hypothetical protein
MYQVFYESKWLKIWKPCGEFATFTAANDHIEYLINSLPWGYSLKFRINNEFNCFRVTELIKTAA